MGAPGTADALSSAARALALAAVLLGSLACAHRPRTAQAPEGGGAFHTVAPGETVTSIAHALGSTQEAIARENALDDPDHLSAGRVLWVPHARSSASAPIQPEPAPTATAATARSAAIEPVPESAARLLWPVRGVLISRFGDRHGEHHEGIDLAAPEGTHIVAAASGTVVFAGEQRGYGQLILVSHGPALVTVYAHNEENLVRVGDKVERGQVLARVGRTGNATGPHLHFEVRRDARAVDPLPFLR